MHRVRLRPLLWWGATLLWCLIIFTITAQPWAQESRTIPLVTRLAPGDWVGIASYVMRKAAHVAEFGLLGALAFQAFRSWPGGRGAILWAWTFATLYAISDEMHQALVPGRTPLGKDVLLDAAAAAFTIVTLSYTRK